MLKSGADLSLFGPWSRCSSSPNLSHSPLTQRRRWRVGSPPVEEVVGVARSTESAATSETSPRGPPSSSTSPADIAYRANPRYGRPRSGGGKEPPMKLLFVEMGVGYDQHGQDITAAAMRACRDAISSNSIPAFRRGSIPGVNSDHMKLQIRLGVPRPTQQLLDIESGQIIGIEVVDGGLICSSGVCLEAMGDKTTIAMWSTLLFTLVTSFIP
ncbi:unnamed protein product [Spirodela intermedia]|uniref:Uncharacterized protein n=1 Tax=Spirodela intermedia TaxID=51605 RepID=A0A7I8J6V2_SPIIN|nr:unnamed protein product [Spirodela intermedia]CAA6665841.1 unnamed protein product [Spirodela intermedia]